MVQRRCVTLGLLAATALFYIYTLAPTVTWADGARLQLEAIKGASGYLLFEEASQIATDGLPFDRLGVAAWDHPFYILLGQVFKMLPFGEAPQRITLMSALAATLAITLVFRIGLFLSNDIEAALLGAIVLAISHTFWFHAVTAEVYALFALFMISLIGLALYRPDSKSRLFALLAGLGLATHLMLAPTLFIAVLYMMIVNVTREGALWPSLRSSFGQRLAIIQMWDWRIIACIGWFVVGFAPWWIQFLRMANLIGTPLTLKLASGYPWVPGSFSIPSLEAGLINLLTYAGWLIYQFTPLGVAFGVFGVLHLVRTERRAALFLLALFLIHASLSANYNAPDRFALNLPSFIVFAVFIVSGIAALKRQLDVRLKDYPRLLLGWRGLLYVIAVSPIALYALTPHVLPLMGYTESRLGIQPIGNGARNTLKYFLDPNKRGDDSALRFGHDTFAHLAPNAFVLTPHQSDGEVYFVLRYFQLVENLRPDVHLELMLFDSSETVSKSILDFVYSQAACRPIYFASQNTHTYPWDALRDSFDVVPEANLFRLIPRHASLAASASSVCPNVQLRWTGLSPEQLIENILRQW